MALNSQINLAVFFLEIPNWMAYLKIYQKLRSVDYFFPLMES